MTTTSTKKITGKHIIVGQQQSDQVKNNEKLVVSSKIIKTRNLNLIGLVSW